MNEELTPQKERFLREVEQQLLRKDLDANLLEDGLLHVQCNERPLCSVDGNGTEVQTGFEPLFFHIQKEY